MDFEIHLRNLLINDNDINKKETEYLLSYLNCKINTCQNTNNNKLLEENKFDYDLYMNCLSKCYLDYKNFYNLRVTLYKKVLERYYNEYSICRKEKNKSHDDCMNFLISNTDLTLKHVKSFILKH